MNNQELQHHGVKGMKWGIRKKPETSSSPKAVYKQDIARAKENYKQANIARAKAKLNRDLQGPQGSTRREMAKNYLKSEVQNKAEKLKSQVDYEDAVQKAERDYIQTLRERGQAKKEAARAAREERRANASQRRKTTVAAIAATAAVAIGASIISKKLGVKKAGGSTLKDYASENSVLKGQTVVNDWMSYSGRSFGGTRNQHVYDTLKRFKKK